MAKSINEALARLRRIQAMGELLASHNPSYDLEPSTLPEYGQLIAELAGDAIAELKEERNNG